MSSDTWDMSVFIQRSNRSFLFFFLIFLFAMERSTLNSEVPSLQTYRFVPGTTAEKHEHSEFANCCQTDPAAI